MNDETILDKLEARREASPNQRIDRARLFRADTLIVDAVSSSRAEVAAIRQAARDHTRDMQRAYRLNVSMDDGELRKWLDEYRLLSELPEKIEAGLASFDNLQDSDFDEFPYPENSEHWQIVSRRMANKLFEKCYVGAAASRMKDLHSLTMSKLKDIDRKATFQGVNPFTKKSDAPRYRQQILLKIREK